MTLREIRTHLRRGGTISRHAQWSMHTVRNEKGAVVGKVFNAQFRKLVGLTHAGFVNGQPGRVSELMGYATQSKAVP